jgi:two-component system chemotaxis sensor kinase CheA
MVPVGEVLDRLPLVVQGLRRSSGKRVRLELQGTHEELDKSIAERLFPALLHLVRNAVDHGLESPAARAAAGKSEEGYVRIACSTRNNRQLEIEVSDDGRGIERSEVARRARAPGGRSISDRDLLDLLCQPGLSTKGEVTTTSGRGMGMDIVRRVVAELGGELSLGTTAGKGTRFTLRVPLTLTIVDAFVFGCAGQRFVVPVGTIEEIFELEPSVLAHEPAAGAYKAAVLMQRRGEAMMLLDLARALSLDGEQPRTAAFVIRRDGEAVAFAVERVVGQQEAVVRPLLDPLVQAPGIAGTTDLGDGRATLVLDLASLASGSVNESGGRAA